MIAVTLTVLAFAFSTSPVLGEHNPNHAKGKGGGLTGTLVVTVTLIPDNNAHLHATVTQYDVGVKGAEVVLTITAVPLADPDNTRVFERENKTDPNGVAHFEKTGKKPPRPGTYTIDATATKDQARGECTGCLVFFLDERGNISVVQ